MLISQTAEEAEAVENGVLKNFAKFSAKHMWCSVIFKKLVDSSSAISWKKRRGKKCFPENLKKVFKNNFFAKL